MLASTQNPPGPVSLYGHLGDVLWDKEAAKN